MDQLPALHEGPLENTFIHEHPFNVEYGWYYFIHVRDYDEFDSIIDCEYIARVISVSYVEIDVIAEWKRLIIDGNEQRWEPIEPKNLTIEVEDMTGIQEVPCVRFYRRLQS